MTQPKNIVFPSQLEEIRNQKAWINYILIWNESKHNGSGGYDKPPVNPNTLRDGSSTDPARWTTFDDALANIGKTATIYYKNGGKISAPVSGVGLILDAVGLVGIDFDGVIRNVAGKEVIDAESLDIISFVDSYAERSPSGSGVHVLAKGRKPGDGVSKIKNEVTLSDGSRYITEYEIYDKGRYFTFTGNVLDGYSQKLENRQDQINKVYRLFEIRQKKQAEKRSALSRVVSCPRGGSGEKVSPGESDLELWEKMFCSRRGSEIRRLYDGDLSVCSGDHSACDLALCNHLAYWTNLDASRVDRMFRQSGLVRPKWTKDYIIPKYGLTYREWTISTAMSGKTQYRGYTDEERRQYAKRKQLEEMRSGEKHRPRV